MAYLRAESAEGWRPYKARPSSSTPLGRRFETGTLPYELLAGFRATIAYLDSLGGLGPLRDHERALGERFLASLPEGVELYGPPGMAERVPTFLLNLEGVDAAVVANALAAERIGVWAADNWYCVSLAARLPPRSLRVGFIHYNTAEEVDRLSAALSALTPSAQLA
jgi:selenocysteine lyase/cysteine desulfurase